jgi:hypothetical protein
LLEVFGNVPRHHGQFDSLYPRYIFPKCNSVLIVAEDEDVALANALSPESRQASPGGGSISLDLIPLMFSLLL